MILADERDVLMRYDLPDPYFGSAPAALLEGLQERGDVEVHILSCVRKRVRAPKKIAENIYYHAVQVSRWGFLRMLYLPCIIKIRRKLRIIRPDVVHGQGTERYQGLAAAYSGFPSTITIHGNMRQIATALGAQPFSFHWLTARLEPLAIRRTGGIICLSRHTFQQVDRLARKTWVLPNAVQTAFYKIQRAPAPTPTILCVANIAPYKNQNLLMLSLDPIAVSSGLRLVFLGRVAKGDPYGQTFMSMVKERPWCVHAGFQADTALREYFRTAHLLVLPTNEDNCPMVVLEAMAAGLPVAASRVGGVPDLITNRTNGVLFTPNDPLELRNAVTGLLSDQRFASKLAKQARELAFTKYYPSRIADLHLKIYHEICAQDNSPTKEVGVGAAN
jgi:glycosyltransferase involved in cell wall biosynthesis